MSDCYSGTPFGDYDPPSDEPSFKYKKMSQTVLMPLSPSFEFAKLRVTDTSIGSTGSEDSDDEAVLKEKTEQLRNLEYLFKQSYLRNQIYQPGVSSSHSEEKLDLISEEEKKRLRNTEAARRCREKIKRKAEELEMELSHLSARNDLMNQHRIRLLSQVEEQMRMLELMRARNPAIEAEIRHEAKHIVDSYANQVEIKRRAIQEYFDKNCTKFY